MPPRLTVPLVAAGDALVPEPLLPQPAASKPLPARPAPRPDDGAGLQELPARQAHSRGAFLLVT